MPAASRPGFRPRPCLASPPISRPAVSSSRLRTLSATDLDTQSPTAADSFVSWTSLFDKIQNTSFSATGALTFLPEWQPPLDDPANQASFLSDTGASEAFHLGVQLRNRYKLTPGGDNLTVWAASQQRVLDTAHWFLNGYLSSGHYDIPALSRIVGLPDSVNFTFADSLTPSAACPNYVNNQTFANNFRAAFRPSITARLNKMLDGLVLDDTDIGAMMDLCPYQTEISGFSPFCNVFTKNEWLQFEYSQDLQYFYGSGPGNSLAGTTAFPLLKTITDLFLVGPGQFPSGYPGNFTPPPLIMGFTHEYAQTATSGSAVFIATPSNNIPPLVAALGLLNDSSYAPLDPFHSNPDRKFRSSFIVPFRGTFALERMSCTGVSSPKRVKHIAGQQPVTPPSKPFVRVKINDGVVPLPTCRNGPGASCPLEQFAALVEKRGKIVGDFVVHCGLQGVTNATSSISFLTNPQPPFFT